MNTTRNRMFQHATPWLLASSLVFSGAAMADTLGQSIDKAGSKIESGAKQADAYIDDSAVTARVKAALLADEQIKSLDIGVETQQGIVLLSGFVNDMQQSSRAAQLAANVPGVKEVRSDLRLKDGSDKGARGYLSDTAITSQVKAALLADADVKSFPISVSTSNGRVQLSGVVRNKAQVLRAAEVAGGIQGVTSVKNDLRVK